MCVCPDALGTAGDEWDGVERAIIERILRSAAAQGGRELPSIGDSTPPGRYRYSPGRRAWVRVAGEPPLDGLLVLLSVAAGSCSPCADFAELAAGAAGSGEVAFELEVRSPDASEDDGQPRLSISCLSGGQPLRSKRYRGSLGLPEISALVVRAARACPSVDERRVTASILAVCPCAEL